MITERHRPISIISEVSSKKQMSPRTPWTGPEPELSAVDSDPLGPSGIAVGTVQQGSHEWQEKILQ